MFPGKCDARPKANSNAAKSEVPKPGSYKPPKIKGALGKHEKAFEPKKQG